MYVNISHNTKRSVKGPIYEYQGMSSYSVALQQPAWIRSAAESYELSIVFSIMKITLRVTEDFISFW
jgi:hypothetical protein